MEECISCSSRKMSAMDRNTTKNYFAIEKMCSNSLVIT